MKTMNERSFRLLRKLAVFLGLVLVSNLANALFTQCPPIQQSAGCSVLFTIAPSGAVTLAIDPSVGPYDGVEDTLVGVVNKSGGTVFGIFLQGPEFLDSMATGRMQEITRALGFRFPWWMPTRARLISLMV